MLDNSSHTHQDPGSRANHAEISNNHISSEVLFNDVNVVTIQHGDRTYFLRKTRNGKLILTK